MAPTGPLAQPPRIPAPTRTLERTEEERRHSLRIREQLEHRSILRGLLVLAVAAVLFSILRADFGRVFPHGWWRP